MWFPLMTPEAMKTNFTKLGIAGDYDFSKPSGPTTVQDVKAREEVTGVIMDMTCIHTPYGQKIQTIIGKEPG